MTKKLLAVFFVSVAVLACSSCGEASTNEQISTPSPSPTTDSGSLITIDDYYNASGGYSALGLALDETTGEKMLAVHSGDTLEVNGTRYQISVEILTLPFYTQTSLAGVNEWWADYCESRIDRGEMIKIT
ncbi:MAG: hypothetical protein FWF98_04650 [Dehalococcoidia bacterium]|nr:hypothetical protein [Dehalococcoidia bacterium]